MFTVIIFIAVLAVLVLAHEFGHFIVAKRAGVRVEEFGFGFPPRFVGIQRIHDHGKKKWRIIWGAKPLVGQGYNYVDSGNTVYSLNWLPLGGFVSLKGENGEFADEKDGFRQQKAWIRLLVLSAGVLMNLLLAAVLLSFGFMRGIPMDVEPARAHARVTGAHVGIVSVLSGTPAAEAGIIEGDIVKGVDDQLQIHLIDLQHYINTRAGTPVSFRIERNGTAFDKQITPITLPQTGKGGIGVALAETGLVSYSPPWAVVEGFRSAGVLTWETLKGFGQLITGLFQGQKIAEGVTGPVGIAVLTGKVARMGFVYLLQFMAILSINLAILNIIPFPALDGGRVLFVIIEMFRRGKPVDKNIERTVHAIGFTLLILLVLVVTFNDLSVMRGAFSGFFKRLF
ncbi:MAG: Membrane-associated zinc metalloprotease [Candidatus Magasanikbacteria bacterium GW2011_GWA2_45_39]|uniref:Zinc metalloprotease n=1 Tax=Candidatus Magasanikbacteria bacterium GW2011_GWA2_45_39 TaxID=1619041 RepID=A0A0G1MI99_9BACT|nr:MAG: Membrane-associated zinc metalloprotease [Candidatus Magasanikbacteria bacterium GW2011_GWA2_45_39]HBW74083.1 RIP metalloprotease RseP [Candidatus Magasanikbacteria bacterium]